MFKQMPPLKHKLRQSQVNISTSISEIIMKDKLNRYYQGEKITRSNRKSVINKPKKNNRKHLKISILCSNMACFSLHKILRNCFLVLFL